MATINKQYSFIWYGKCIDTNTTNGGCTSFTLDNSGESAKIDTVWQVDVQGDAKSWVNGATGNSFSTLECGHAYYIKLKEANSACVIPNAELSGYSQTSGTAFRITEDCNAGGGGGGTVLQASIALGACQSAITLSATQLDSVDSYTSCQLQKTGATFVAISDTLTDNIRYNLTDGGLLSYKIDNTDDVGASLTTGAITITANADEGYGFGSQSNELIVTINGSVTALPKPVINITPTVSSTNTVTFIPDFNDATHWGGTKWKYRLKNAIGQPITDYTTVTNFQSNAIDITNDFDHAGTYTIDAEIVTIGGDSIAGSTKVEDQTINIPRLEANISVGNIAHGTIDRDTLPDTKTASVTATNISGDWAIHTNAETAAISASQNNNNLQSVLNTQELGVIDSDNKVTISALGTKWNQAYSVNMADLVLGPASNEVTAECTITATVTDGVVFTSSESSVTDNTRDTDDSIPTPTKITITHDDVDSWVASLSSTSTNWKFSTTQTGTYSTDPTTLSKSGLDHAPGTFEFWVKYDTDSVADETLTLTLSESATDGHSGVANITITLTGEVTQAIGTATMNSMGPLSLTAITSGGTVSEKSATYNKDSGVASIAISDVSAGWTATASGNNITYNYTGETDTVETKTGTFKLTGTPIDNSVFSGADFITVTMSLVINAKTATASMTTDPSGVGSVTFGEDYSSQTDTFEITTNANANITIPTVPITQGDFEITNITESGGVYTYTYKIKAGVSAEAKSATYEVTVNADTNSKFVGLALNASKTINVTLSGTVNPKATALTLSPTTLNFGEEDQNASVTPQKVSVNTITEISQIVITSATGYKLLDAVNDVTPKDSLTLATPTTSSEFYVVLDSSAIGTFNNAVINAVGSANANADPDQTVQITCNGKVNEVVVADDLLWVNFGFADATKQIASDWYELEQVSESTTQIPLDNMEQYNQMAGFGGAGIIPTVGIEGGFQSATMVHFSSIWPFIATNLPGGVAMSDLDNLPILGTANAMYVEFVAELDYTKFQIASSDSAYATELQSWLDTNSVSSIRGLMMTTSPTRPTTLTTPLATKAFNDAELLNLHCNVSECGPKTTSSDALNFRLIADVKTAGAVTSQEGKYTFNCSAANYIGEGKPWENAYAVLTNASGGQINKSDDPASAGIVITDMYFIAGSFGATTTETKVKLSTLCS